MKFQELGLTDKEKKAIRMAGDWIDSNNDNINETLGRSISSVLKEKGKDIFHAQLVDGEPVVLLSLNQEDEIKASPKDLVKCFCGSMGMAVMALNAFMTKGHDLENGTVEGAITYVTTNMILKPLLNNVDEVYFDYVAVAFYDSNMMPLDISKHMKVKEWIEEALGAE